MRDRAVAKDSQVEHGRLSCIVGEAQSASTTLSAPEVFQSQRISNFHRLPIRVRGGDAQVTDGRGGDVRKRRQNRTGNVAVAATMTTPRPTRPMFTSPMAVEHSR
jgi:hypothetical protein